MTVEEEVCEPVKLGGAARDPLEPVENHDLFLLSFLAK